MFNKKKKFFKEKVDGVEKAIWDLEFKISKSRQVREGVRQDRDRSMEAAHQIDLKITTVKNKEKELLEKEKEAHLANAKRYEAQMKMIDDEINGVKASGENPGQEGNLDRIAAYTELKLMYLDYIQNL